jgi:hypothetical protein
VKSSICLAAAALTAMMFPVPTAVAQDEDTMMPEQNVVVVEETELEQIVGQPLPKSGGLAVGSVLLPAAALLLGSGVLAYAVLRRRGSG